MRNALKGKTKSTMLRNEGFSLLELAIVLVLVGMVIAPAISLYHQYRVDKDWDETELDIDSVLNCD